jgi:hypothetical protein
MKKYLFILIAITMFSCTDDYTYITEEQNTELEADIKAYQMRAIGPLFESIARQPEMSEGLINSAEAMLYENITDILPISDTLEIERGMARGYSFASMFDAIARQPEAIDIFEDVATQFLGKYDATIISDKMLEFQKTIASVSLMEALARQPEAYNDMDTVCQDFFNCNLDEIIAK